MHDLLPAVTLHMFVQGLKNLLNVVSLSFIGGDRKIAPNHSILDFFTYVNG